MTYNITFLEADHYYFAFRDGQMINLAFDKRLVTKDYVHLLGAAASMYETLGNIQNETYKLAVLLDESMRKMPDADKTNVTHLVTFLHNIQDTCLNIRRLAEVGTARLTVEIEAENKLKKV